MADYENSIFNNLPRRRQGAGVLDDERPSWREVLSMRNFDEGPLPPRPHVSGKGGPSINQGSKPPVVTSVWSASDAAANAMTLSNGGLTVTPSGGAWQSIRSSISKTTGQLYIEFTTSVAALTANLLSGLASSGFNVVGDYLGDNPYSMGLWLGTTTAVSAGFTSHYISNLVYNFAAGDIIGLAVDFSAGNVWLAKNNVWSNSSNPATGTLPIASFVLATVGPLFAGMSFDGASGNGVWTLQPTAAAQKYAPPSGFSPWDGGTPAHSPQAIAYLARTVGGNEGGNATNIATLIDGLVSDGVWSKLDCLYVLAQQNQTDSLLNLVGTSYTATNVGSATFTAYTGYGFSSSAYLDTHFNAATVTSPNFTQNVASIGIWSNTQGLSGNDPSFGNGQGSGTPGASHILPNYSGSFYGRINDWSSVPFPSFSPPASGLFTADRQNDVSNVNGYYNGTNLTNVSATSVAVTNADFYIGAVPGSPSTTVQTLSAAFIGASLGSAGQLALYNRLRTYMTAVGVP